MRGLLASPRGLGSGYSALGGAPAPALGPNAGGPPAPAPVGREAMRRCLFGAYMRPDLRPADRPYAEVAHDAALLSTLEAYMAEHDGADPVPQRQSHDRCSHDG